MRGKWLPKCGCTTAGQNGGQKQSKKSTLKPVGHGPLPDVSGFPPFSSAAILSDKKEAKDICQDVNKAAEYSINKVHKDFELQRTLSDRRYYGYLERAT